MIGPAEGVTLRWPFPYEGRPGYADGVITPPSRLRIDGGPLGAHVDAAAITRIARDARASGLEEDAIGAVSAAARRARTDPVLWQWTGVLARALEDSQTALHAFGTAARLAPGDARIAHSLARVTLEAGRPAVALFERALRLAPADGDVLLGLGAAEAAVGETDAAIARLDAALQRNPGWIAGHDDLVRLRWMAGDRDGFTSSLDQAVTLEAHNPVIWNALAVALVHARRFAPASDVIAPARAALGDTPFLDAHAAVIAAETGEVAVADMLFARLAHAEDGGLAVHRVRHLLRTRRVAAALPVIDRWIAHPQGTAMWPYASIAWRLTGDIRAAWLDGDERLVSVVDLTPSLPPLDRLAQVLRSLHQARAEHLDQSVRGGTQTTGVLFARLEPEIVMLRRVVSDAVTRHLAQLPPRHPAHPILAPRRDRTPRFAGSWSVRLHGDGHHANHIHAAGWVSSAFYVALPDEVTNGLGRAGWLTLGAPQAELGLALPPLRLVEPRPGRLVLFPSTMWHGTTRFAKGERLTVAFDVAHPAP